MVDDMIKFYIPDGHLESKTLEMFEKAGFKVSISSRSYNPAVDDDGITLKRLRPQDFPFVLALGKGDLAVTGSDIVEEFKLKNKKLAKNVVELLDLGFGRTKLSVAVSLDATPGVRTISDFRRYALGRKVVVATEYPEIVRKYLRKNKISAVIQKPAGKTEAWVIPPLPEADMIVDTTETGRTLVQNRCRIIDTIRDASAVLIANRKSLKDPKKRGKIGEVVQLFRSTIKAKGKVIVYLNVTNPKNLKPVLGIIEKYVKKPTVSDLEGGGYDIFIVIDERDLKYILPKLTGKGASSIVVSDTRMIFE